MVNVIFLMWQEHADALGLDRSNAWALLTLAIRHPPSAIRQLGGEGVDDEERFTDFLGYRRDVESIKRFKADGAHQRAQ